VSATAGETLATASQAVNIGAELKRELERVARAEGRDVTNLARRVLQDYVREHRGGSTASPSSSVGGQ
jgi:hypothetical protein